MNHFSPSSSLNSKKITSQDDIGSVAPAATPLTGLPSTGRVGVGSSARDDSSIASGSSGFGSLPKKEKKNDYHLGEMMDPALFTSSSIVTDSGISENSEPTTYSIMDQITSATAANHPNMLSQTTNTTGVEHGHSRNSSNTSQVILLTIKPIDSNEIAIIFMSIIFYFLTIICIA